MPTTTPESWISLDAGKNHLNIPLDDEHVDQELARFIARAEGAIVRRVGHVSLATQPVVQYLTGGRSSIAVAQLPVGVVEEISVQGAEVPRADRDAAAFGWYVDDADESDLRAGIIRHTTAFPRGFLKVTYLPGRDPVPHDLELAALEMLRHLWKTQRGSLGGRAGVRGEQVDQEAGPRGGAMGSTFSVPSRVVELIAPFTLPAAG